MSDDRGSAWQRPGYPNYGDAVRGFGGVVAPLLTGFSLAATVALLTTENPPPMAAYAIIGFTVTIASLLFCIQYSFLSVAYWVKPGDLVDWRPEAKADLKEFEDVRQLQRTSVRMFAVHQSVAGVLYDTGILSFLGSATLLLVPDGGEWTPARWVALSIACAALLAELLWLLGPLLGQRIEAIMTPAARRRYLVPGPKLPPTDTAINTVASTPDGAQAMKAERDRQQRP